MYIIYINLYDSLFEIVYIIYMYKCDVELLKCSVIITKYIYKYYISYKFFIFFCI